MASQPKIYFSLIIGHHVYTLRITMAIKDIEDKRKTKLFNLRVSEDDFNAIVAKAILYADGNVSDWVRYASTKLEPKSGSIGKINFGSETIPEKP